MDIDRRTLLGSAAAAGTVAALGGAAAATATAATAQAAGPAACGDAKDVLITGTSSGFGRLTALTLAREGHRVYASMRNTRSANAKPAAELRAVARAEDLVLEVIDIDTRDERPVEAGVAAVRHRAGRIDVLVNNAGMFYPALMETVTVADVAETFETNVFGHLRMNRAVLPVMRRQQEGLVVQITTALGRVVLPFLGAYQGAKWAMEAITEASRYELSQLGVEFTVLEPGGYDTDFVDPNGVSYYQRYVRRLAPSDARRREEYGALARRVEAHLEEEPGPDPQEVADTVSSIIGMARGERPVRMLGPGMEFMQGLNDAAAEAQLGLMQSAGFEDLLELR